MKIDPYNYPLIIIAAFVIGMILAMVLGFRPQHGSSQRNGHGLIQPAIVQAVETLGCSGV
jgi:hypothetical protein